MASPILQRRHAELIARLGSLETEFEHWRQRTASGPLARHHSQVRRLASQLGGLLEPVRTDLPAAPSDSFPSQARRWECAILAAHTLWEFFRSKLVLRESELFQSSLAACDDLAWACYRPFRDAFGNTPLREPPLVYLNATWSPFAMPRDQTFAAEIRAAQGVGGQLSAERFQAVLDQLPIPLISLPWYQTAHLPAGLIVAHEVGHIVDWDFNLDPSIEAALKTSAIPTSRLDSWIAWRHEVFADLFAVCAAGPAFVGSLMDLLAASPAELRAETGLGNLHPPRTLRVALACEALRKLGFLADAARLASEWDALAGPISKAASSNHADDAPTVVHSLFAPCLRGHGVPDLLQPPAGDPEALGGTLADNGPLDGPLDIREAFAAARWIQEHRPPRDLKAATAAIHRHLAKRIDVVRSSNHRPSLPQTGTIDAGPDVEAGRRLLRTLFPDDWPVPP